MGKEKIKKIKFIIFIVLLIGAIVVTGFYFKDFKMINIHEIIDYCEEYRFIAMGIFLIAFAIKPFLLLIPANILAIASGILFGPIIGFTLTMVGFFISGTIAFLLARFLGKDFVESILGKRLMSLDNDMEKKGFKILFYLRLPPVIPYDPLSYASGLTKIKYRDFITASLIGVVPETLCYSIIGREAHNPLSPRFLVPLVILILAMAGSKIIMDKRK